MGLAQLNVEIAARLDKLQGGLKNAEKMLAQFGRKMQASGENLSVTLSAPLAALAGASIKAAGDYENLRNAIKTTMTDSGRSVQDAAAEVDMLRKAALAPGLDFEQAVRASIRLQSVGYSAEQARKIVTELANAITMSGGTAEDLDGVTRQFSQMIAKGKVLNEDLMVVSERLPKLAGLMQKAFGTTTAEGIRAAGISAQEFVAGITKEMQGLQRVEGGISNAIVNASSAVKQFLGKIGEEINRAFNLTKLSDDVSRWLGQMGNAFAALDAPTKRSIVGMAAVVIAVGPVIKVFGMLSSTVGSLMSMGSMVVGWGKMVAGAAMNAVVAFNALNIATRSLLIAGGIIGLGLAIGGLIVYFANMNKEVTAAQYAAEALADVQSRAGQIMAAEKVEVEKLTKTLKSETASREQKEGALKRLKAINADYFGDLSVEKSSVEQVNGALSKYIVLIEKRAKLTAANEKLAEIEKELLDVQLRMENSKPGWTETLKNGLMSMGNGAMYASAQAKSLGDNFKDGEKKLNAQKDALLKLVEGLEREGIVTKEAADANSLFSANLKTSTTATGAKSEALKKLNDQQKKYAEVLEDIRQAEEAGRLLGDVYGRMADAIGGGIEKLVNAGFSATSAEVKDLMGRAEALRASLFRLEIPASMTGDAAQVSAALEAVEKSAMRLQETLAQVSAGGFQDTGSIAAMASAADELRTAMTAAAAQGLSIGDSQGLKEALAQAEKLQAVMAGTALPGDLEASVRAMQTVLGDTAESAVKIPQALEGIQNVPTEKMAELQSMAMALGETLEAARLAEFSDSGVLASLGQQAKGLREALAAAKVDIGTEPLADLKQLETTSMALSQTLTGVKFSDALKQDALNLDAKLGDVVLKAQQLRDTMMEGLPSIDSKLTLTPVQSTMPKVKPVSVAMTTTVDPVAAEEVNRTLLSQIEIARQLRTEYEGLSEGLIPFSEAFKNMSDIVAQGGTVMQNIAMQIGGSMMQAAESGASSFKSLANAAIGAAAKVVKAWIQQGVAAAVSKALTGIPFPFNMAAGAVAGAGAAALFSGALRALKVPALAAGGLLTGPSMVLAGEYPNASINPEVIAPLDKLQGMLGGNVVVVGGNIRFTGRDMLLAIEAEQRVAKRSR